MTPNALLTLKLPIMYHDAQNQRPSITN